MKRAGTTARRVARAVATAVIGTTLLVAAASPVSAACAGKTPESTSTGVQTLGVVWQ